MTSADGNGVYLTHEEYAALLAERDKLKAEKWHEKHTDTMNQIVSMGLAIEGLEAERDALRGVLEWQVSILDRNITKNDLGYHRLRLPDGSHHTGPVVNWVHETFTKWRAVNIAALKGDQT